MAENLFGYVINNNDEEKAKRLKTFIEPNNEDGAIEITAPSLGSFSDTFIDFEGAAKSEAELVTKYRNMEMSHEVERAIDDIINEAIIYDETEPVVSVNTDKIEYSENVKKKISDEFQGILELLDFNRNGHNVFKRHYVDGRIYYHVIVDDDNYKDGIKELRYIDPRKIRKVREVETKRDPNSNIAFKTVKDEYYIYNDRGFLKKSNVSFSARDDALKGLKISKDAIIHATSGILNETNDLVLSHLHTTIKPLNQLRMLEDASVIYRLARAPERRIFYIDVGNLPKMKAEQYLRDQMVKHKNRLVYDASNGEIKQDKKFMNLLEDFWLPRREGGRGTEITNLPGGQNLGEIEDILYFQKKLFNSMNVPVSRLEPENMFSSGRSQEISRDEIKFSKFIQKLRSRFIMLFDSILEKQLILKGIIKPEEWKDIKKKIRYDFMKDNHYEEIKESEVLKERLNTLNDISPYIGRFFSQEWVNKHVLRFTDDEIKDMGKQIAAEPAPNPEEQGGQQF